MRAGRFRRAAVRGLPAVIVSSGVSPALSQLASGASHPAARRWLICALSVARVRWSAARSLRA
jgi:hypothetical protein